MRRPFRSGAWLLLGLLYVGPACGGGANSKPDGSGVAGLGGRGGSGAVAGGSGGSAGGADGGLAGCLDQPGALDRPPNGRLPCELIPPGLRL